MTLRQVTHDEWFKLGVAAMAFAIAMMSASLLLPPDDDEPQAWTNSDEG